MGTNCVTVNPQAQLKVNFDFLLIDLVFNDFSNLNKPKDACSSRKQNPKANAQWWKPLCQTLLKS